MDKSCRQCGKRLPYGWSTDICLECSESNVKKLFDENPDLRQAFKESIDEMKKPENVEKMSKDFIKVAEPLVRLHNEISRRKKT